MQAIYSGEVPDRLPHDVVSPWAETLDRWYAEGLPMGSDPNAQLGLARDDIIGLPLNLNMVPTFAIQVLEMDNHYVKLIDEFGVTKRMLRADYDRCRGEMMGAGFTSAMSQWLDFPVKDITTWKAIYEEHFQTGIEARLPGNWTSGGRQEFIHNSETRWVMHFCFPLVGMFGPLRQLMGLENLIYAMADDPHLIHVMVEDLTNFWLACYSQVLGDVRLDEMMFFEDMCATKAPLICPSAFNEFFAPGYKKVVSGLRSLGVQQFFVDSDGNLDPLIPTLMECGIDGIHPCEVQSGMDVQCLRGKYPQLNLNGGIDKRALTKGPDAIDDELRRCYKTAWKQGRYTPTIDHAVPPDISWKNIQHYAQRCLEFCQEPPI